MAGDYRWTSESAVIATPCAEVALRDRITGIMGRRTIQYGAFRILEQSTIQVNPPCYSRASLRWGENHHMTNNGPKKNNYTPPEVSSIHENDVPAEVRDQLQQKSIKLLPSIGRALIVSGDTQT